MRAMVLPRIVSLDDVDSPLEMINLPLPEPKSGEVLVKVTCCGVCHTELDEIEGRTLPSQFPIVLGHQIVGHVAEVGMEVSRHLVGDRVGVGWIHSSTGADDENLADEFTATGCDANGGYAEYLTVPEDYAYAIPQTFTDEQAAPLFCAGAIGYRALRLCNLCNRNRLGFTGFGASAHLVLPTALALFSELECYVFARDPKQRRFALELGAVWAGDTNDRAPHPLDAIIDTTPAWTPVVEALANLRPGGRLVINAIRKQSGDRQALLDLDYEEHLWREKEIKTVANITQHDIRDFLPVAADVPLCPEVECYPLERANEALMRLKHGGVRGALVLKVS